MASPCVRACLGAFAIINDTCECIASFAAIHSATRPSCDVLAYKAVPLNAHPTNTIPMTLSPNVWTTTSYDHTALRQIRTELYRLARPASGLPRFTYFDASGTVRGSGKNVDSADGARIFVPVHPKYDELTVTRSFGYDDANLTAQLDGRGIA